MLAYKPSFRRKGNANSDLSRERNKWGGSNAKGKRANGVGPKRPMTPARVAWLLLLGTSTLVFVAFPVVFLTLARLSNSAPNLPNAVLEFCNIIMEWGEQRYASVEAKAFYDSGEELNVPWLKDFQAMTPEFKEEVENAISEVRMDLDLTLTCRSRPCSRRGR